MQELHSTVESIVERNARVERDKAWETSMTRRGSIALMTYLTASIFLWLTGNPLPLVHALVPAGGYLFSTLSLPWLKNLWLQKYQR